MTEPASRPETYRRSSVKAAHGECVVCGRDERLDRDHCHKHGYVRGLVCRRCNIRMRDVDQGRMARTVQAEADRSALVDHWHKCPDCAVRRWKASPSLELHAARLRHRRGFGCGGSLRVRLAELHALRLEVEWTMHRREYGRCFDQSEACVCRHPDLRIRNRQLPVLNGCEIVEPVGEPGQPLSPQWPTRTEVAAFIRAHRRF